MKDYYRMNKTKSFTPFFMNVYKLKRIVFLVLLLVACKDRKEKAIQIFHLLPDEVIDYPEKNGYFNKVANLYFVVKNFDSALESHRSQLDDSVLQFMASNTFLRDYNNVQLNLVFYAYGGEITEKTKHE